MPDTAPGAGVTAMSNKTPALVELTSQGQGKDHTQIHNKQINSVNHLIDGGKCFEEHKTKRRRATEQESYCGVGGQWRRHRRALNSKMRPMKRRYEAECCGKA